MSRFAPRDASDARWNPGHFDHHEYGDAHRAFPRDRSHDVPKEAHAMDGNNTELVRLREQDVTRAALAWYENDIASYGPATAEFPTRARSRAEWGRRNDDLRALLFEAAGRLRAAIKQ